MKIKASTVWIIIGLCIIIVTMNNPKRDEPATQESPSVKSNVEQPLPNNTEEEKLHTLEQIVRKIPASNLDANLEGYKKLLQLAPSDQSYMDKLSFYKQKIETRETALNLSERREPIKVPSDPSASYYLLNINNLPNGNLEVTTRREGKSGKSYAIRLVQCNPLRFDYIAEGYDFGGREEVVRNLVRIRNPELTELVRGSISDVISRYACQHQN